MIDTNDSPIIWYIPGFLSGDDPQEKVREWLESIYPDAEAFDSIKWENQGLVSPSNRGAASAARGKINMWNVAARSFSLFRNPLGFLDGVSMTAAPYSSLIEKTLLAPVSVITRPLEVRWLQALKDVGTISNMLANRIRSLSSDKRQKLILIGHSLGGNIVIHTLAQLYRQYLSIHSAVLLGAAIDAKDKNILLAMKATLEPIHSMYNPSDSSLAIFETDTALKTFKITRALGKSGCGLEYDHTKFYEHCIYNSASHSSDFYLSHWAPIQQKLINLRKRYQSKKRQ